MRRAFLGFFLLVAAALAQTPASLWRIDASGNIVPAGGRSVAIGATMLSPTLGTQPLADWCVDSVNGDDLANDGTCPATGPRPYKTLAKLQAQTITSGQK